MQLLRSLITLLSLLAIVSQTYAETIIETHFGENTLPIHDHPAATGVMTQGVLEDSGWADLKINYSTDIDTLGGLLKWLHADLTELNEGRAQLKWRIPSPDEPSHYQLQTNLGSPTKSRMRAIVMQSGAPYTIHWEQTFVPDVARANFAFDFQLPAIDHDVVFLLAMEQVGEYDLANLQLIKRSSKDIETARAAAIAAAPDNLAPNAGFALGLPTGWTSTRQHRIADKVQFRPAAAAGPNGTVPLIIDVLEENFNYELYSSPFGIPDPESIYIVSFIAKGEATGQLAVLADGNKAGSGSFTSTPEGTLVKIPFQGKELAKWYVIQFKGSDDLEIDALNVSLGRQAKPFTLPGEVEVALDANRSQANVFVEGVEEPRVEFAITGELKEGMVLMTRAVNLYGQFFESNPFDICCDKSEGFITPVAPDPNRPYGSVRFEAWVERDGEPVSPVAELVYHVVPKPVYWGQIAPESRFGHHINQYAPHLYGIKAIGSNWARFHGLPGHFTTYWMAVEPEKGTWTWQDENINAYRDAGFATMGVLVRVPAWARIHRPDEKYNGWLDNWWQPRDYEEYGNYVESAINHHADNIDAWMVWNEPWGEFWFKEWRPDLGSVEQWHKGDTPEEDFKELSRVAWEAYKRTGSDKPFLSINGTMGDKGKKWMRDQVELGTQEFGNGISYHAYFGGDLNYVINNKHGMVRNLDRRVFEPIEASESASSQPIWMTEGSWLLPDWGTGLHYHSIPGPKDILQTVREIAIRVPLYHVAQLEHGVEKVFTYAINAGPRYYKPTGGGTHNWGFMVTQSGELHPSAVAYSAMSRRLEEPVFNRRIQIDSNTAAFVFDSSETQLVALFGTKSLNDYLQQFNEADLKVDDFLGNPATEGIEHQLLYIELAKDTDVEPLLEL